MGHVAHKWMHDIVCSPAILDQVEQLIGPNIMCWGAQFFVKEPGSGAYIGWHQVSNEDQLDRLHAISLN
jgi:non-heme Fe2+,alpha-ketoglutarate-dependent halogenase